MSQCTIYPEHRITLLYSPLLFFCFLFICLGIAFLLGEAQPTVNYLSENVDGTASYGDNNSSLRHLRRKKPFGACGCRCSQGHGHDLKTETETQLDDSSQG